MVVIVNKAMKPREYPKKIDCRIRVSIRNIPLKYAAYATAYHATGYGTTLRKAIDHVLERLQECEPDKKRILLIMIWYLFTKHAE